MGQFWDATLFAGVFLASAVARVAAKRGMSQILKLLLVAFIAALLCAAPGCGAKEDFEFDELDLTPAHDEMIEFPLGKYIIPIPLIQSATLEEGVKRNRVEFAFSLYAVVSPECKKRLSSQWKRHEGKLRDRIILVCRRATAEELQESELATLKSHLTDAVHAELGTRCIRRLLISEVLTRKL
jgi:flagellar basal body-associated protein FliL